MDIQYSKYNGGSKATIQQIAKQWGSSNTSSNISSNGFKEVTSSGIDRVLWGNEDDGEDLNGTLWVDGNIYLGEYDIEYEVDEDGDDDKDSPILPQDDEETSGNIYAKGKIEADSTYGKTVYLDYPERDNKKTDLLTILKDYDDRIEVNAIGIKNNTDEIVNLTEIINDHTIQIETNAANIEINETTIRNLNDDLLALEKRLNANESNGSDLNDTIDDYKNQIEANTSNISDNASAIESLTKQLETLKYGDIYNPVILYSGVLSKSATSDIYTNSGCLKDCLQFNITDITDGLMTIELTPRNDLGKDIYCYVRSVDATQEKSEDTQDREAWYKGRNQGAHWFESWFKITKNKTTVYLREFHQGNGDNDTWYSSSWFEEGSVRAVNLTINGYVWFIPNN